MMKKILNASEDRTFKELLHVSGKEGLAVFAKVRVADILPIENSGIDSESYSYALKSHFDFVVATAEHMPLFAVEFDGPLHTTSEQSNRDTKKNALCERFKFPLLRINTNHLSYKYNDRTLLAWIIEVYRLQEAFYEAQAEGYVPPDEPFDPFFIVSCGTDRNERFPYWISLKSRLRIQKLYEAKRLKDFGSSGVIWRDADVMRGLEFIRVTETHGLSVESAMRDQLLPIIMSDLLDELLHIFLGEKVERYFAGEIALEPLEPIYERINSVAASGRALSSHSVGRKK